MILPDKNKEALRKTCGMALAVMVSASLLTPNVANAQSKADLNRINKKIEAAKENISRIGSKQKATKADYDRVSNELGAAQNELDARNRELEQAQTALANIERALAATTEQITLTSEKIASTKATIEEESATFKARIRQSYIEAQRGGLPIMDAASAKELGEATHYLRSINNRDQIEIEKLDVLRKETEADEERLEVLKARQAEEKVAAENERNRVNELVKSQEALVAQVKVKVDEQAAVLKALANDASAAQEVLDDLEAESNRIEKELAEQARREREAAERRAKENSSSGDSGQAEEAPRRTNASGMILPVRGRFTSPFGYRIHPISRVRRLHTGQDIGASSGTAIAAAKDGTVTYAGWRGGYGNCVIISHGGGVATLYAHQSRIATSVGASVSQGQTIGYVGSTGASTGPHLHWEVRINGRPVNPMSYV